MTTLSKRDNQLRFLLLISIVINVTTIIRVKNRPVEAIVVHKVDNATVLHGKITGKLYTIDCGAYGKFLVTKEQYDNVQVYLRSY